MGSHGHEHASRKVHAPTQIIVVSTSRTKNTDETGPLVASLLESAGHRVIHTHRVPDEPVQIGETLDAALADPTTRCILLCGGTGFSARDQTPEVVESRLDRVMPGFGEQFRALSFADVGPAGILSRATGGISGNTAVFALPGSPKACKLALEALVLPLLRHLVHEVDKETPNDPARPLAPPAPSVEITAMGGTTPAPSAEHPGQGWQRALQDLDGTLGEGPWPQIDPHWPAPVRNVLESAGARAPVQGPAGQTWSVYGYPDLTRPSSKVLLVGDDWLIALHRHPAPTGICSTHDPSLPKGSTSAVAEEITGVEAPIDGRVIAIDTGSIFIESDGQIHEWDGRQLEAHGTPGQLVSSLTLRWSQR